MKIKRIVSLTLALLMLIGCFSGCGKKNEPKLEVEQEKDAAASVGFNAKGRYVEKTTPLPESMYAYDMVMLTDGRLKVAVATSNGSIAMYTSSSDRNSWAESVTVSSEVSASGNIECMALSPDGKAFCSTIDGTNQNHFWAIDATGTAVEIPMTYSDVDAEKGFLVAACDFTNDGRLMAQFYFEDVREIDLATGSMGKNINELEPFIKKIGCAGNSIFMMGENSASIYANGTTEGISGVLKDQLTASLQATEGNLPKITFADNSDGYLFFTTHDGLYCYVNGGGVTEELVSGARTSLGDPRFTPQALAIAEDNSFYVLGSQDGESVLYHYTFDTEVPVVTDTELYIYSLYEDEDLRQMISQFQKANPEVTVKLEIGMTGQDGITEADAIRTLNTEILAGNGPDMIRLDGFSIETYTEKGLLADVSHVLDQAGPLLEQITHCYETNGSVYAVPTTFAIPAIYGPSHIVSQVRDIDTLVAAMVQAQGENTQADTVLNGVSPIVMADMFYDSCSAAWMNSDGTLDAGKLTAFYDAMQKVYALDASYREAHASDVQAYIGEVSKYFTAGAYTGLVGGLQVLSGAQYIVPGTLDGMTQWAFGLAGDDQIDGYSMIPLDIQASHVFMPRRIMGIMSTSNSVALAEKFLSFMLSDEVQAKDLTTGFPVNKTVFDTEIKEDRNINESFGSSDSDGNEVVLNVTYPDASRRQELKTWVSNLTTPALTNRTIRNMVMEQMQDCCDGIITPEQAAQAALQTLNLYLSE